VLVVAAGALVCSRLLRGRVDPALVRRTLLVLLFCSLLTERLRDYNAEVLTATLFAVGILCIATGRHVSAGWSGMVLGVVNTPAALAPLLLVAGAEAIREKRLRRLWPVAAAALLVMTEDWVRRGGPLTTGYDHDHGLRTLLPYSGRPDFSYPLVLGLVSILFSFGRGLLFFTPGLALWLDRRTRRLASPYRHAVTLMLLTVCGLVLIYAKWWAWYGGLAWGPRFFAFAALPSSFLIAVRLGAVRASAAADALTLLVLALSVWVALAGVSADLGALDFCKQQGYQHESLCWYAPDFSSLWRPVLDFPPLSLSTGLAGAYCLAVFVYLAARPFASVLLALRRAFPPMIRSLSEWKV
jgi:hypothetical protein